MDPTPDSHPNRGVPTYLGPGDPAGRFTDYYPAWIDKLADDATVEGSLLDGAVQGAEAVRTILVTIRGLYDRQTVNFAGPWGDNGFVEDATAQVRGEPIASVVLVTLNARGPGSPRRTAAGALLRSGPARAACRRAIRSGRRRRSAGRPRPCRPRPGGA